MCDYLQVQLLEGTKAKVQENTGREVAPTSLTSAYSDLTLRGLVLRPLPLPPVPLLEPNPFFTPAGCSRTLRRPVQRKLLTSAC